FFESVITEFEHTNSVSEQIEKSLSQQTIAIQEFTKTLTLVAKSVQEQLVLAKITAKISEDLMISAEESQEQISGFKLLKEEEENSDNESESLEDHNLE
ncbi:hypothetical protein MJH12_04625, partial [bacterium]|nr:hypothetical protein [bacterium]